MISRILHARNLLNAVAIAQRGKELIQLLVITACAPVLNALHVVALAPVAGAAVVAAFIAGEL